MLVESGHDRRAGGPVPGARGHPLRGPRLRRAGARARRRARAARRGPRVARARHAHRDGPRARQARRRPAHRARARLLHRHRLRDAVRRPRGVGLVLLGWSLRRARQRRTHDLPRRGHLDRRDAHPRAAHRPWPRHGLAVDAGSRARRADRRRGPGGAPSGSRPRCAGVASPARSLPRRRSSASRSATPSAAASRSSGSRRQASTARSRTSAPASRCRPTPRRGVRPLLTCAPRSPAATDLAHPVECPLPDVQI